MLSVRTHLPKALRGKRIAFDRSGCEAITGAKVSCTSQSMRAVGNVRRKETRTGTLRATSPSALGRMIKMRSACTPTAEDRKIRR